MSALLDLAGRCERAAGADRELDAAINDIAGRRPTMPGFTASLDAAMTLVPEGWTLIVQQFSESWTVTVGSHPWFDERRAECEGDAATFALALCAAALRVRALTTPQDKQGED